MSWCAPAWLTSLQDNLETHIPGPLFCVSLRRRLRIPIWGDSLHLARRSHGQMEGARHFLFLWRGTVLPVTVLFGTWYSEQLVTAQGLLPEVEKPGILPAGASWDDDRPADRDRRRPADVWYPQRLSGHTEAWDLSRGPMGAASPNSASVFAALEARNNFLRSTAARCSEAGFWFRPWVLSSSFRSAISLVSSESNRSGSVPDLDASLRTTQRISCTLYIGKTCALSLNEPGRGPRLSGVGRVRRLGGPFRALLVDGWRVSC